MSAETLKALKERAKWRCRRGLLELDILFARFIESRLDALSESELEKLLDLLATDDIELWSWVSGRSECPVAEWKGLIASIRQA